LTSQPAILRILAAIGAVALGFLLAEVVVRIRPPRPRVALVRAGAVSDYHVTSDGTLLYSLGEHYPPCNERLPGVKTNLFAGSSIMYGSDIGIENALPHRLEMALATLPGGSRCSDDVSQPGFGPAQEFALIREAFASTPPEWLFVEVWDPARKYSVVGDFAFDSRGRRLDALGVPVVEGVPEALGDALFRWSYLYQYTALALSPPPPPPDGPIKQDRWMCDTMLPELVRLTARSGTRLILLVAAPLDRPLETWTPENDVREVTACAARQNIEMIAIAQLLADQKVEDVRLDPCCHLNAHGHALLAERILPRLLAPAAPEAR
jgi:hypothetical protein